MYQLSGRSVVPSEDAATFELAAQRCFGQPGMEPPSDADWEALRRAGDKYFASVETPPEVIGTMPSTNGRRPNPKRTKDVFLTIFLTIDAEKDLEYARWFFDTLWHWNRVGLNQTQVIAIAQRRRDPDLLKLLARVPFAVDVVWGRHEQVNGYPVWDLMDSVRRAWGLVQGCYVTFAHPECILCPERLQEVIDYLAEEQPSIALGNLRRTVPPRVCINGQQRVAEKEGTNQLLDLLASGNRYHAAAMAETMPTVNWMYKDDPQPGRCFWCEDVFFAERKWLEAFRFLDHTERMAFQDVYDLIGMADYCLSQYGFKPDMLRMPQSVHRAIHLYHPRKWGSWTPQMAQWFLSSPARWDGTNFTRPELWDRLVGLQGTEIDAKDICSLRRGRGGTVTRFAAKLENWLLSGDCDTLVQYYRGRLS